jgi:integrase
MKTQMSSAAQVASFPAGVHSVKNAPGLYLRKSEGGSGSWFFRYYAGTGDKLDGDGKTEKRREKGLGSALGPGAVTLAQAKDKAIALRKDRIAGVPILTKKQERKKAEAQARAEAKKITFWQATEAFADRSVWKHKYARPNWINAVVKYAYPVIGDLLLDDIRIEHITDVIDSARSVPDTGSRVPQRIEAVLNDAARRGQRNNVLLNPADAKLHRERRQSGERPHYRRIELSDAPAAFRAIHEAAADSPKLSVWVFMIATAARPSEALNARWGEINLKTKLWTIPAARMKGGRTHVVPLSSLAIEVLERHAKARTGDAVFPGSSGSPLSFNPFATATAKIGVDAGTPHSWRSVFRDACGDRLRVDRDLAEAALSHTLGPVVGAHRRETAIEARRPVMEAYAQWLLGSGANVIAFPTRA